MEPGPPPHTGALSSHTQMPDADTNSAPRSILAPLLWPRPQRAARSRRDRHRVASVSLVFLSHPAAHSPAHVSPAPPVQLAVLSDIHSNLEALERTFQALDERSVDAVVCLGDVVGYNADPAACVDLVRERCAAVVQGNHDVAVADGSGLEALPPDGQEAARHNHAQLSAAQRTYLAERPLTHTVANCTFVHATPQAPADWTRLTAYPAAQEQFDHFDTDVCFIGHTHSPAVMADTLGVFQVRAGHRYLINVGSVGQPRDGTRKLSFGLFDTEAFAYENVRLDYDVAAAARKIRSAEGLPSRLADRLEHGT